MSDAALKLICDSILDAAGAEPLGVPGGHLYAVMMGTFSLDQFNEIMGTLVRVGLLTKRGECYHLTPKGREARRGPDAT